MRGSRIKTKKGESRERCAERNRANDSVITNRGKDVTEIEQTQPFLVNFGSLMLQSLVLFGSLGKQFLDRKRTAGIKLMGNSI